MSLKNGRSPEAKRKRTQDRPVGVYEPAEEDSPLSLFEFEFEILGKFQNQSILVDVPSGKNPTRVWFLPHPEPNMETFLEYENEVFKMIYTQEHAGAIQNRNRGGGDFVNLWKSANHSLDSAGREKINKIFELFDSMAICLQYNIIYPHRYWTVKKVQTHQHFDLLNEMAPGCQAVVSAFRQGRFLRAFMKGMSNSAGKSAMEALLILAGHVVYGSDSIMKQKVDCFSVGSSDPHERFPVKPAKSEFLCRSQDQQSDSTSDVDPTDSASNVATSSEQSGGCSTKGSKTVNEGVFPDLLFLSGKKPNWPHFVFVGEVKQGGENLSKENVGQLLKEMLMPMMRQSLVFGLLINEKEGFLCIMEQNIHKKEIEVSLDHYFFITEKDKFNIEQFKLMFNDIVCAMQYCQKNIREIYRGF